jgi:hypothetical protein
VAKTADWKPATDSVDDGSWALSEVPQILREMEKFAQALTVAGSRHGPVIEKLCELGLSLLPASPKTTSTLSPPEVTSITDLAPS